MDFLVRKEIKHARRIVVKIGSNAIVNKDGFNHTIIEAIAQEISSLTKLGKEIIIVTSGAIALGKIITNTNHLSKSFYASIGQKQLIHEYDHCFIRSNLLTSQILLTKKDLIKNEQLEKLKISIHHALELGIITIINENDTISHNSFENNDLLAAEIAKTLNADLLILLTNTNGIYKCLETKETISYATKNELQKFIDGKNSKYGTGGMETKVMASKCCGNATTIIANAHQKNILKNITTGKDVGTLILD